jgi:hypothetical protein
MTLDPGLKQRILQAAQAERAPARPQVLRRQLWLAASAVAVPLAAFFAVGGARPGPRPLALVAATAAGAFLIAGVALASALGRRSSMLGRPRAWLVAVALLAPLLLLGWKTSWSLGFEHMAEAWRTRPGFRCFGLTLGFAAWPFAAMLLARRGSDPTHARSLGLALGVAAAVAAAVLVDLWCPVGYLGHLLLGHVLPIGLLGLLGLGLGQRVLAIRAR